MVDDGAWLSSSGKEKSNGAGGVRPDDLREPCAWEGRSIGIGDHDLAVNEGQGEAATRGGTRVPGDPGGKGTLGARWRQ